MSSFKGLDLFGSGPHRFRLGLRRQRLLPEFLVTGSDNRTQFKSLPIGNEELSVEVTGRLVGADDGAVWSLLDAIEAQTSLTPTWAPGVLDTGRGQSWGDIFLVELETAGPFDRGRVVSVGYRVYFQRVEGSFA
ncbi:MAG: hypothetical protein AAF108_00770 [Planctomycetota bacterium]